MAKMTMEELEKSFISSALKFKNGKEAKKFLRKEGTKLKKINVKYARMRVNERTGEYLKGIKRGKAWSKNGESGIRSYNGKKYANTIETGRVEKYGYIKGAHVFRDSEKEFEPEFVENIDKWVDDLLDNEGLV